MTVGRRVGACALCKRETNLTFHLIPRKVYRRTYLRKNYSREGLTQGVDLCWLCHRGIHRLFEQMTLARESSSLDALQANPLIQRHVEWVR